MDWKLFFNRKKEYIKKVFYSLSQNYKDGSFAISKYQKIKLILYSVLIVGAVVFAAIISNLYSKKPTNEQNNFDIAIKNYRNEVILYSKQFNLNRNYIMAVIMLESSGKTDVPSRFEPAVFKKLKDVQNNNLVHLEYITKQDLKNADDAALRNLASSWGPFQLMGYKCIHLGIKIKDLRGVDAVYYGIFWIDQTYGDYIRQGRYQDAFHIHNTGHPVPANGKYKTYDPNYVTKGMKYMKYFEENMK